MIIRSISEILFSIAAYINGVLPEAESTKWARGSGCGCSAWSALSTALSACSHPDQSPRCAKTRTRLMAMSVGTSFPSSWYWRIRSTVLLALRIVLLFLFLTALGEFRIIFRVPGDNVKAIERPFDGVEPWERLNRGEELLILEKKKKKEKTVTQITKKEEKSCGMDLLDFFLHCIFRWC